MGRSKTTESRAQLDTDLRFHACEWRIQRIGWSFVGLFLLLALAGAFGGGPLSHARASGPQGMVEYERFVRNGLPTTIVVTAAGGAPHGVGRVSITASFLEAFRIERITPAPTAVRATGQRLVYEFAAVAPGASISFHVHPQRLGRHTAEVSIDAGAPLAIRQLTYP
jgi:hypothetical protein